MSISGKEIQHFSRFLLKYVDSCHKNATIRYAAAAKNDGKAGAMRRFGQLIKLKPGVLETYKRYHASIWPEVAKTIRDCNIRNYSIFQRDGFLYAYMEYVGSDFEADMARMGEDPKTQEWWAIMKPMQEPIAARAPGEWWADMEEVFHQD